MNADEFALAETTKTPPAAGVLVSHPLPLIPDHTLMRRIGQGSYGEVWLGRNVMGGWRAIKIVYRRSFTHSHPYEREFAGIRKFEPLSRSHEGLVDVLHVGRNDQVEYFFYVMELADDAAREARAGEGASTGSAVPPSTTGGPAAEATPPAQRAAGADAAEMDPRRYVPLTLGEWLRQRGRLPLGLCAELGLKLASALAHLHKHGLVHRDIKPSNIIFVNGLAKLADIGLVADIGEARSYVGTEGFIPPEGAGTVQADIYALGKVLYEMSMGKDRREYPELPTNLGDTTTGAATLELNEVILRACRSDCRQRYQTADAMHADLELLQKGASLKRLRKVERRLAMATRIGIGAGIAALLAIGGYVGSIRQIQRARAAEATARNEARRSREVTRFLKDMLNGVGPSVAKGRDTRMLKEILEKTTERVGKDLGSQPDVASELLNTIGMIYRDVGDYEKAKALQNESWRISRGLGEGSVVMADALASLGALYLDTGELDLAERFDRKGLDLRRKLFGGKHPSVATSMNNLAAVFYRTGRLFEAEQLHRQALAMRRELLGGHHLDVARSLNNLANVVWVRGDPVEAELLYIEALTIFRNGAEAESPVVGVLLNNLAMVLERQGKLETARARCLDGIALRQRLFKEDHPDLGVSFNELAAISIEQGRIQEAEMAVSNALAIAGKALDKEHPNLADCLATQGVILSKKGEFAAAEQSLLRAQAIQRKRLGQNHPDLADSLLQAGFLLAATGQPDKAEAALGEALAIDQRIQTGEHQDMIGPNCGLGWVYATRQDSARAEGYFSRGFELSRRCGVGGQWALALAVCQLTDILRVANRSEEAERLLLRGYERFENDAPSAARFRRQLAERLLLVYQAPLPGFEAKAREWAGKVAAMPPTE